MNFLIFIIPRIIYLYIIILLLRIWMKLTKVDFYHPLFQFVVKITNPIINFFQSFIPGINKINNLIFLISYILTFINIFFVMLVANILNLINISLLIITFIQLLTYFGRLFFWLILIRIFVNYIMKNYNANCNIVIQLTEPLILPFRNIIPNSMNLDLSIIIVILILISLNYLRLDIMLSINSIITNLIY